MGTSRVWRSVLKLIAVSSFQTITSAPVIHATAQEEPATTWPLDGLVLAIPAGLDLLALVVGGSRQHKRAVSQVTNPIMHMYHISQCTIQHRNVHISFQNGTLWDMGQVHCGICEIGHAYVFLCICCIPSKFSSVKYPFTSTVGPKQNGCHFADYIFWFIFFS